MTFNLSEQQDAAIKAIVEWYNDPQGKQVFYLGGLAGTGKSYLIPPIIDALGLDAEEITLCAPTAMAARVVRGKLEAAGLVASVATIHRAIYQPKLLKAEVLEMELAKTLSFLRSQPNNQVLQAKVRLLEQNLNQAYDINDLSFRLNPDSTVVHSRLVVVDESSMVGQLIAADLKSFGVRVIAIGDPGQLQPVDDKPGLCVGKPDALLTEIHRQAKDNPIILYSHLVRMGEQMPFGDYGPLKIIRAKDDEYTFAKDRTAQIICGMNRTRWDITQCLRLMAGFESNAPQMGEPLIVCKNSKTIPSLINGAHVTSMRDHPDLEDGKASFKLHLQDEDEARHVVTAYQGLFEEHIGRTKNYASVDKKTRFAAQKKHHHVDFGWVMTCHKAQGSQWPDVIVHDESRVFREDAANWIYTAATRAAETLVVVRDV